MSCSSPSLASPLPSLWEFLGRVPDRRGRHGRRYTLQSLLALGIVATLCGYKSYGAMAEWIDNYGSEVAEQIGFKIGRSPSVGTLFNTFSNLDRNSLESVLDEWATLLLDRFGSKGGEALSIDGKYLKSGHKQGVMETVLISAVSHELGVIFSQRTIEPKQGEIVAVRKMIQELVIEGKTLTLDALHTNPNTAEMIVEKGGTTF
jgi:DDE_Tnp_1-associated